MPATAADLLDVYDRAQITDPLLQQATATRLAALGLPAGSTVALANFVAQGGFAERSRADTAMSARAFTCSFLAAR